MPWTILAASSKPVPCVRAQAMHPAHIITAPHNDRFFFATLSATGPDTILKPIETKLVIPTMVPMSRLPPPRLPVKPASTGIIIVWQDMKQKHAASTNTASLEKIPFPMSEFSEKKFKQLLTRREIKKFKKLFKQFLNDSPQNYPPLPPANKDFSGTHSMGVALGTRHRIVRRNRSAT